MGLSLSSQLQVFQPLSSQWLNNGSLSYCTLLKNLQTSQQLQLYSTTSLHILQQQLAIYERRYHQNLNLVKVISVQKQTYQGFCTGSIKLLVATERIVKRLSEIRNLKYEESVSVLYSALIGFKAIFQEVGFVEVNDQMIGFTRDNKCRVWLNQNFSKNQLENQYQDHRNPNGVYIIVMELVSVVSNHSVTSLNEFSSFVKSSLRANPSFDMAIAKLQEFIKAKYIRLPAQLTLVEQQKQQTKVSFTLQPKLESIKVVNEQPCVMTSDVFEINPKEPNIQQKYNKSVEIPRIVRYQTPQKPPIKHHQHNIQPQMMVINPNLLTRNVIVPHHSNRPHTSIVRNQSVNERKVVVNYAKSPETVNFHQSDNSGILKRSVANTIPPQHKHHQTIKNNIVLMKSPVSQLKRYNINSLSNLHISSKQQNSMKISSSKPKLSRFHPQTHQHQIQNIIPPTFTPIKHIRKQSSGKSSLKTTGEFVNFPRNQDSIISEQVTSESKRMNSFIPSIPLSSNDDERIDLQQIVATMKSDLDDVEISKNTIILVDKLHSNQLLPLSQSQFSQKNFNMTQTLKQSQQQQLQWSDFQSVQKQSSAKNTITYKDPATVTFGANSKKEMRWLSPQCFRSYTPIESLHINVVGNPNPEIRKVVKKGESSRFVQSKVHVMNSRSRAYL